MTRSQKRSSLDPPLGHSLAVVGLSLAIIFLAAIISALLQPGILKPGWILGICNALISQGPLAVAAIVLFHLSVFLNREDPWLRKLRYWASLAAIAAALGFVLLVPVQLQSLYITLVEYPNLQALRMGALGQRLVVTKRLVDQNLLPPGTASTRRMLELVAGLRQAAGMPPYPQGPEKILLLPSSELRITLKSNLDEIESRLRAPLQGAAANPNPGATLLNSAISSTLSSLALALAFLACSRLPGESLSPLLSWQLNREARKYRAENRKQPTAKESIENLVKDLSQ